VVAALVVGIGALSDPRPLQVSLRRR